MAVLPRQRRFASARTFFSLSDSFNYCHRGKRRSVQSSRARDQYAFGVAILDNHHEPPELREVAASQLSSRTNSSLHFVLRKEQVALLVPEVRSQVR